MSSSSLPAERLVRLLFAIGLTLMVAACSFTPAYGPHSAGASLAFNFAEPGSRLEQIVYNDLSFAFGRAAGPDDPLISVTVTSSGRGIARSASANPEPASEAIASGTLRVTSGEEELFVLSRQASATYTKNGQIVADRQAKTDADERAAEALADIFRLALIGRFGS